MQESQTITAATLDTENNWLDPNGEDCFFIFEEDVKGNMFSELVKIGVQGVGGWFVKIEHSALLDKICEQNNINYLPSPPIKLENIRKDGIIHNFNKKKGNKEKRIYTEARAIGMPYKKVEDLLEPGIRDAIESHPQGSTLLSLLHEYQKLEEQCKSLLNWTSNKNYSISTPITSLDADKIKTFDQLLEEQEKRLKKYRGKEFIGLPQKSISFLDESLSGLRKFMLIAAAPNIGKTAITIQLGIETIKNNPDTCLLFVSCEMSREDILDRMRCYLTPMVWRTLYFGNKQEDNQRGFYNTEQENNLTKSKKELSELGNRIRILDEESCPNMSAEKILAHVNDLKNKSESKRIVIIIDYLQVFPIPSHISHTLRSDLDMDNYRVEQMKLIRNEIKTDPLIVISEARKPSSKSDEWTSDLADISGSKRISYCVDAAILMNALSDKDLATEIGCKEEDTSKFREELATKGISLVKLTIAKARDGMQKGKVLLKYHFFENRFEQATKEDLCKLVGVENIPHVVQKNFPNTSQKSYGEKKNNDKTSNPALKAMTGH